VNSSMKEDICWCWVVRHSFT